MDINLDSLSQSSYNEISELNELDLKWLLYLFVCEDSEERENMYQDNPMMRVVMVVMKELEESLNELLYYDHEKFFEKSLQEEAKEKVRTEEKIETATRMLQDDLDVKTIQKYTNLPIEEIEKIKNS